MEFDRKKFGENLKKYRDIKELSQEKLGEMVNLRKSTISKYENGDLEPSLETIMKISSILGITPNDLFGVNQNKNNDNDRYNKREKILVESYRKSGGDRKMIYDMFIDNHIKGDNQAATIDSPTSSRGG